MQPLNHSEVDTLLELASGSVSYQSNYARTTTLIDNERPNGGRIVRHMYASDHMTQLLEAERKAKYVAPIAPRVSDGPRTRPFDGPFPRGKHSHRCKGCEQRNGQGAVACYKAKCSRPQLTATCEWCRAYYGGNGQ